MHNLVNVIRCDTRFRRTRRNVQHLSRQPAHLAHAFLLLHIQHGNLVPVDKDLLGAWYAILRVVWEFDGFRHLSSRRQWVYRA
jgi:hypothetical protein